MAGPEMTFEEHVARAIHKDDWPDDSWEDLHRMEKAEYRQYARAAIRAYEEWHAQQK